MESEIFCRKCSKFQEKKGGGGPSFDGGQPPRQGRRDATDGKIHEIGDLQGVWHSEGTIYRKQGYSLRK